MMHMVEKMKANWLFKLIFDGAFILLGLSRVYSILWGPDKHGQHFEPNAWIIITGSFLIVIIFYIFMESFCYFYVDNAGMGLQLNVGFFKWPFFKGLIHYKSGKK